jgi:phage shock protein A
MSDSTVSLQLIQTINSTVQAAEERLTAARVTSEQRIESTQKTLQEDVADQRESHGKISAVLDELRVNISSNREQARSESLELSKKIDAGLSEIKTVMQSVDNRVKETNGSVRSLKEWREYTQAPLDARQTERINHIEDTLVQHEKLLADQFNGIADRFNEGSTKFVQIEADVGTLKDDVILIKAQLNTIQSTITDIKEKVGIMWSYTKKVITYVGAIGTVLFIGNAIGFDRLKVIFEIFKHTQQ